MYSTVRMNGSKYDKTVTRKLLFIMCCRKIDDITSNQPAGRIELDSTCKTLTKHKCIFVIFARTLWYKRHQWGRCMSLLKGILYRASMSKYKRFKGYGPMRTIALILSWICPYINEFIKFVSSSLSFKFGLQYYCVRVKIFSYLQNFKWCFLNFCSKFYDNKSGIVLPLPANDQT